MATLLTDGILLVDKPAGVSSHDVVAVVRRARHGIKAGHTGTLDPFATGLLVVALGRATRLIRFMPADPKVYRAVIRFGEGTETDDATGNVSASGPIPDEILIQEKIRQLTGVFEQVPPAYSARHVGGRRAYAIARTGVQPELSPSRVTVNAWAVEGFVDGSLTVTISCGAGTYIRALARDLGHLCGTVAHLVSLRRTRIGPFDVREAVAPDDVARANPVAPVDALVGMARQVVGGEDLVRLAQGRPVSADIEGLQAALVNDQGALIAVADRDEGMWQPRVVLGDA
jgi:tRNA pseudouridine55 synthase